MPNSLICLIKVNVKFELKYKTDLVYHLLVIRFSIECPIFIIQCGENARRKMLLLRGCCFGCFMRNCSAEIKIEISHLLKRISLLSF